MEVTTEAAALPDERAEDEGAPAAVLEDVAVPALAVLAVDVTTAVVAGAAVEEA